MTRGRACEPRGVALDGVDVLLNIHTKCITGEETLRKQRAQAADGAPAASLMWMIFLARIWRRPAGYRQT